MKTRILYLPTLVLMLIVGCKSSPAKKIDGAIDTTLNNSFDKRVSIINLIATPDKFNHKKVRVKGFLNLEFEDNAVYLHKEDSELGIDKNGIWLEIEGGEIDTIHYKTCNKQYVIIEGTFEMNNKGHDSGYSGALTNITRVDLLNR